jgi:hypothetical protein
VRNGGRFCPTAFKINDGVCRISLDKKGLVRLHVDDSSTKAGARKKSGRVERRVVFIGLQRGTSFEPALTRVTDWCWRIKRQGGVASEDKTRVFHIA